MYVNNKPAYMRIPKGTYRFRIVRALERIEDNGYKKERHAMILFKLRKPPQTREEDYWVHMYPTDNPDTFYSDFVNRVCELCKINGYYTEELVGAKGELTVDHINKNGEIHVRLVDLLSMKMAK